MYEVFAIDYNLERQTEANENGNRRLNMIAWAGAPRQLFQHGARCSPYILLQN